MAAELPNLLIAEDMWMNTLLFAQRIPKEKLQIIWVQNGEEAIKALNGESFLGLVLNPSFNPLEPQTIGPYHFKAAVLDNQMGNGIKGIEVYQRFAEKIPAFMYSADSIESLTNQAENGLTIRCIENKPHPSNLGELFDVFGLKFEQKESVKATSTSTKKETDPEVKQLLHSAEIKVYQEQIAESEKKLAELEAHGRKGKLAYNTIERNLVSLRERVSSLQTSQP